MKIIVFLIVFFAILLAMRWWSAHQRASEDRAREDQKRKPGEGEAVVRCIKCGVHIPKSNALMVGSGWRCADETCQRKS
jgi:uncharacterized protein